MNFTVCYKMTDYLLMNSFSIDPSFNGVCGMQLVLIISIASVKLVTVYTELYHARARLCGLISVICYVPN